MAKKQPKTAKKAQLLDEPEVEFTEEELRQIQERLQEVRESDAFKQRIKNLAARKKPVEVQRYNITVSQGSLIFEG